MTCGNVPRFIKPVCTNESCCVRYAVQMVLHFLMGFTIQVFFVLLLFFTSEVLFPYPRMSSKKKKAI